ncbi:MAG: 16S rRNA (uracil(1498)-N(3))-methyltransferase [Lewinellaceae bacterium]|nr:16S rRNA (uracil(1498)-N(3))-methyltransferase [Lewinellaceae bacterium]
MQLFFCPDIKGDLAELSEEEARHAMQVLRHQVGDELTLFDGQGNWYTGTIVAANKKKCQLQIQERRPSKNTTPTGIHLAIAPTKQMDRLEWFLEKATEIGVSRITPLQCFHSERGKIREDRLEKVILSAAKQSLQAYLPQLDPLTDFMRFIGQHEGSEKERFIAYVDDEPRPHLWEAHQAGQEALVLIGPEGDFSVEEISTALKLGFQAVSLGANRLRTETAGVVAVHTLQLKNLLAGV